MAKKYVYFFGRQGSEGRSDMKNLLGGKGANLCEMANLGIPTPPGFVITTEVCTHYYQNHKTLPAGLDQQVRVSMAQCEKEMGCKFGDASNPLLVSVRSGARISMPGMMETVLNLGLNDDIVEGIIRRSGNERFGWDLYRRFVQMFSAVVMNLENDLFNRRMDALKENRGVHNDTDLTAADLKQLTEEYKQIFREHIGKSFPDSPWEQLEAAIGAVFESWNKKKARDYRKIHNVPESWGTAVNVCSMVYGNMGDDCATGVAFTRDPSTGAPRFFGEWLRNAQGEDVVAGIRTPQPINESSRNAGDDTLPTLERSMPECYRELERVYKKLELHYKDMQDIEFTIQNGKLWMLQTRNGKRTAPAAIKIAVDLVTEGVIDRKVAVQRVDPDQLDQLLHPMFDEEAPKRTIAKGINASPGAAVGKAVFTAEDAVAAKERGEKTILVRLETSPEDVSGMHAAEGILTARGGKTSHAAVVARGMGKCCVCGAGEVNVDEHGKSFTVRSGEGTVTVRHGDFISLDGTKGEVYLGQVPLKDSEILQVLKGKIVPGDSELFQYYEQFMRWADDLRTLGVRTNADTPEDSRVARLFGAEGIGLCRTEHMFFEGDRIKHIRQMIVAETLQDRKDALRKLINYQREDFVGIFRQMAGLPVTIRLLDPPLHEFLPHDDAGVKSLAAELGVSYDALKRKVTQLAEANPMLGHRGCRLGIVFPEITETQARAIFEAAALLTKEGVDVKPEVMVPLVGTVEELRHQRSTIDAIAKLVMEETKSDFSYLVGTMIEVPRAALTAGEIASEAEFFSFGTNDLTQMGFGYSRDDAGKFLPFYVESRILPADPFQTIDIPGVGRLIRLAVDEGRAARKGLKCGICGEHGGDPASVKFCHSVGLDYVSCSPYRVPIARLAAAQAAAAQPPAKHIQLVPAAKAKPKSKPAKKASAKKASAKKPATTKAAARPAAKAKKATRKTTARKGKAVKKAASKKAVVKKAAVKKATAKKAKSVKKVAPKKSAAKAKKAGRKPASPKAPVRKASKRKPVSRKRR